MLLPVDTDGNAEIPRRYEDQSWDKLKLCIEAVFDQKPISFLYDELYRAVENMCTHNMACILYQNLETECRDRVLTVVHTFQQYPSNWQKLDGSGSDLFGAPHPLKKKKAKG